VNIRNKPRLPVSALVVGLGILALSAVVAWFGSAIELACTRASEQAQVRCDLRQVAFWRFELDRVVIPDVRAIETMRFTPPPNESGFRRGTTMTSLVFVGQSSSVMPGYFADLFIDDLEHLQLFVSDRSARSLRLVSSAGNSPLLNGLALLMVATGLYLVVMTATGLLTRR
jgi:hypothetical protein